MLGKLSAVELYLWPFLTLWVYGLRVYAYGCGLVGGTHVCVCMYVWTCLWRPEVDIECLSWLPTTLFVGRLSYWTFNLLFQPVSLTTLFSCLSFPIWDYGGLPHPPPSSTWAISPALFLSFIRRCGLTKSPRLALLCRQALYLWSDCHGQPLKLQWPQAATTRPGSICFLLF